MASSPSPFQQLMDTCDQAEQLREAKTQAWTVDSLSAQVHEAFLTRGEALPLDTCREAAQRVLTPEVIPQPVIQLDKPTPAPLAKPSHPASGPTASPEDRRRMDLSLLFMGGAMVMMPFFLDIISSLSNGSQPDPLTPLIQSLSTLTSVIRGAGLIMVALGGFMFMRGLND